MVIVKKDKVAFLACFGCMQVAEIGYRKWDSTEEGERSRADGMSQSYVSGYICSNA